ITAGVPYTYVKETYPDASILKLGMPYPFPDDLIRTFAQSVKELVVIEELDPFLEEHLKAMGIAVRARHKSWRIGELRPEFITPIVKGEEKEEKAAGTRKPQLCKGCPHGFVYETLKKLNVTVSGDIGCYTLGALPPLSSVHTCVCMGAGVTIHEGLRRGGVDGRVVGVVGDSTFIHSGITGLINAVYNKAKGLIMILDNSTTAMTGGQNHPGTGRSIRDEIAPTLNLEELCRSCGVQNVDVIRPNARKELEELIAKRLDEDALSVIITRSPCLLTMRKNKAKK
ncbi:MAG: thiamine pyrophosphate-dependent enzyme, partial [Chitinivibrionales bacterium]